jgi:hypothetical protein
VCCSVRVRSISIKQSIDDDMAVSGGAADHQTDHLPMSEADDQWTPFMETALSAIFALSDKPENTVGELVYHCIQCAQRMLTAMHIPSAGVQRPPSASANRERTPTHVDEAVSTVPQKPLTQAQLDARDVLLCRVLALVGHASFRLLIHLEEPYVSACATKLTQLYSEKRNETSSHVP